MIAGRQPVRKPGLVIWHGTAKYKIRPTNIVMKSASRIKPLDEESNFEKNFSVVACTVYELEFFISTSRQPKG
jgi:hypothetical protein